MRNVLLTGDTGFLGRILIKRLKMQNLVAFGLSENGMRVDITTPFNLTDSIYDLVIHAAGKAHSVPKTVDEEDAFYNVNFQGTKNLCLAIDKLSVKPKAFIFISTVSVYGADSGNLINEEHPLSGTSPYAKSKILAEEFLTKWAEGNNITLGILRLPLIAGPNPPGNLGSMVNGIRAGRYLSIGKANARKSIVWAEDIASIMGNLAFKGGIYNLTDGNHPSFKELESCISSSLNKRLPQTIPLFVAKFIAKIGDFLGSKSPINSEKLDKMISTLTFDDTNARKNLEWRPNNVLDKIPEII